METTIEILSQIIAEQAEELKQAYDRIEVVEETAVKMAFESANTIAELQNKVSLLEAFKDLPDTEPDPDIDVVNTIDENFPDELFNAIRAEFESDVIIAKCEHGFKLLFPEIEPEERKG